MRIKNPLIIALTGITLFFLVISIFYCFMIYSNNNPGFLAPFVPLIVFSGFFIFLIGAMLVALAISGLISRKI